MTIDELERLILDDVTKRFQEYRDTQLPPEPPSGDVVLVPDGGDLQAVLDDPSAAVIELAVDGEYASTSGFIIRRSVEVRGRNALVHGASAPALRIMPSVRNVLIREVRGTSGFAGAVFQAGDNGDTQTTIEQVPTGIVFDRCGVPTHRGKRGFEINAMDCLLVDCWTEDVYATSQQDSQGIWIHNTPGDVEVRGGSFAAGSENIMVGGDIMKIPGVIPTGILIHACRLWRPLWWQTDGVNRTVKTLLELKTGINVTIRDVEMDGCWHAAQDGWAMTFTPRSGGAIQHVLVEHCTITNVAGGWNITGHDVPDKPPTPARTTGIVVRNCTLNASKAMYGGRGIVCLVGMSPETIEFDQLHAVTDGTTLLTSGDGPTSPEPMIATFRYVDGSGFPGKYGIQRSGGSVNGADVDQWIQTCDISGNAFTNADSTFAKNFPNNEYVTVEYADGENLSRSE